MLALVLVFAVLANSQSCTPTSTTAGQFGAACNDRYTSQTNQQCLPSADCGYNYCCLNVTNVNYCGSTAVCYTPPGVPCTTVSGVLNGYGCPCASAASCLGGYCGYPGSWQWFVQGSGSNTNFPSGYTQSNFTEPVCYCPTYTSGPNGGPAYYPTGTGCCASAAECKPASENLPCDTVNRSNNCAIKGSCDPLQHFCQIHGAPGWYYNQACTGC